MRSLGHKKKIGLGNLPGEKFLSPTRPHKSNMYVNIYFLFQKYTHTNKKFPLANLFVGIYIFSPSNKKRKSSLFFNEEKCC